MRITVIVSEAEWQELKRRAGLVPLSRWIRSELLDGMIVEGLEVEKSDDGSGHSKADRPLARVAKPDDREKPENVVSPLGATCSHGATAYTCTKWGCKFYEVPNGRG